MRASTPDERERSCSAAIVPSALRAPPSTGRASAYTRRRPRAPGASTSEGSPTAGACGTACGLPAQATAVPSWVATVMAMSRPARRATRPLRAYEPRRAGWRRAARRGRPRAPRGRASSRRRARRRRRRGGRAERGDPPAGSRWRRAASSPAPCRRGRSGALGSRPTPPARRRRSTASSRQREAFP